MGKGRPRSAEKGVLGQNPTLSSLNVPQGPCFYPTEEEFKDPLKFIYKIRPEAEPYGICRIVPPKSWKPPFALDLEKFTFQTKSQAIHQLQARSASCDPDTFELEYSRFLEVHSGRKVKKRAVVFEGEELDLCKLFNAVKRYGGYDKVLKDKKWGEVCRFVRSAGKISECSKHVLCQLYREHLFDYEEYQCQLSSDTPTPMKKGKKGVHKSESGSSSGSTKRRKGSNGEKVVVEKVEKEEEHDQICEQCNSGLHGEVMLLCDRCDKGWHIYCLSPPLEQVPLGNWYCLECVNSDKDIFGFVSGKRYSLETFRRKADRAKRKWFGSTSVSRLQIEKKFWEIVDGLVGEVEVMYGSDLDTSICGSGFPRVGDLRPPSVEAEVWEQYTSSPWNLNNLPKLQGSMLRAVGNNIAGVMVPWLYIGMLFSSFCWHFEDHCFYSMNYMHWGEPKCWYSVPGSEAEAFEKVMRRSLPDLFEAQPDLLFQLVTMLNPSVLQENDVPVYTVLQEPGNFVITFPRSFHGGFNLGLNCAEAVNFAPADWLPHGGIGAELYRLYHKAAVISHEELLCVVAKSDCGDDASPFLMKELVRIFTKEKTLREQLWKNGIVKSSPMSHRNHPEYVGTEEDPTCIICQQYLYLSSVVCSCRPSASVCLEHWEHLCECSPRKHRLLYRQTLAELNDLVCTMDKHIPVETHQFKTSKRQFLPSNDSNAMTKKGKGARATFSQLAEEWLLSSSKIFQSQFSNAAYVSALKEAEQFLWAGNEMDLVRDMTKKLVEAKKWALQVQSCLSKVETWLHNRSNDVEKVSFEDVQDLLSFSPLPCNEPGHLKLKVYAEAARVLLSEIKTALSAGPRISMDELKTLHDKASDLPIHLEHCETLAREISSAKVWIDSVRQCVSVKRPTLIEMNVLNKLKLEMWDLHVQLPEMDLLLDLLKEVDSWKIRCSEMLNGSITMKELEILLQDADNFSVNIPELNSLMLHYHDAMSWISRFDDVLMNEEREDQDDAIQKLTCILKDGKSLRVQVDQLPLVEVELKRACCREKALKACCTQMSLDFIQQLVSEAATLHIENEKLFVDISRVLAAAISWEERARQALGVVAQMSGFEDLLRTSENIFVILPSLHDVTNALSMAKSWLRQSQPFLDTKSSNSSLKMDTLKDLISKSKLLKVYLEEPAMLQSILMECENWENDARVILEFAESIFDVHDIETAITEGLKVTFEQLLGRVESSTKAGQSLGFDFPEISELKKASSKLQWCSNILSFFSRNPSLEEVENLIEEAELLSDSWPCNHFKNSLITGVRWLRKAMVVFPKCGMLRRFKMTDVEEIMAEAQRLRVSFPVMVAQLVKAMQKHKSWQEKVHLFFRSRPGDRSWSALRHLKNIGDSDAFDSLELDMITSEYGKVEKWTRCCKDVVETLVGEAGSLSRSLLLIQCHLDKSLHIYEDSKGCTVKGLSMCCSNDSADQDAVICLMCKDRYHLSCLGPGHPSTNAAKGYMCHFCLCMENGTFSRNGCRNMISRRKRPEVKVLIELLSAAKDFCIRTEEIYMLQRAVEQALACRAFLKEIVDFAFVYIDKDLNLVSQRILVALKAVAVGGAYDHEGVCKLELALTKHLWKIRAKKMLDGSQKPVIQQIQRLLKEGLAITVSSKDYFMQTLQEVKCIGLQWVDNAKKISSDSGALPLDEVFKLISEGENLTIQFEKELKLLRARSVLYCICRKPYDQRAMIACDSCDEWYHFDCINLRGRPPETYICPACKPLGEDLFPSSPQMKNEERSIGIDYVEPQTPSPRSNESKRPRKSRSRQRQKMIVVTDLCNFLRHSNGINQLRWRNRKPLNRTSKKRSELDSLSPFQYL